MFSVCHPEEDDLNHHHWKCEFSIPHNEIHLNIVQLLLHIFTMQVNMIVLAIINESFFNLDVYTERQLCVLVCSERTISWPLFSTSVFIKLYIQVTINALFKCAGSSAILYASEQ